MKCAHFQNAAFEMGGVFLFFAHARAREGLKKNFGRAGALPGIALGPASFAHRRKRFIFEGTMPAIGVNV